VPSIRHVTPYLLLAALMLGTGLGIGLGLSEAPVTRSAEFELSKDALETCTSFWTPTEAGVTCPGTEGGSLASGSSTRTTITFHTHVAKEQAPCFWYRVLTSREPSLFPKAAAYLKNQCLANS
jgi:hypothetical protein